MKNLTMLSIFAALLMCGGCIWPSEQSCYDVAYQTAKADKDLPKDAKLCPIEKCTVQVLKNAALVKMRYEHTVAGKVETDSYDVWLKRYARTWVLDHYFPTPKY